MYGISTPTMRWLSLSAMFTVLSGSSVKTARWMKSGSAFWMKTTGFPGRKFSGLPSMRIQFVRPECISKQLRKSNGCIACSSPIICHHRFRFRDGSRFCGGHVLPHLVYRVDAFFPEHALHETNPTVDFVHVVRELHDQTLFNHPSRVLKRDAATLRLDFEPNKLRTIEIEDFGFGRHAFASRRSGYTKSQKFLPSALC